MANPNPIPVPAHKRFQPGNPGGGRPKSLLRKDDVQGVMGRMAKLTRAELQAIVEDPKTIMLELAVANIFIKAAVDADVYRFAFLLDRTIGKVKEEYSLDINTYSFFESRQRLNAEIFQDGSALKAAEVLAERSAIAKLLSMAPPEEPEPAPPPAEEPGD